MTDYKPYGNRKTTPSRMARKRARSGVFRHNRTTARAARKAARLVRRQEKENE